MTRMDLSQTVSDLPVGRYEVQVQAAYSPTNGANMNTADLAAYNNGTLQVCGVLYANDEQVVLPTVYSEQYAGRTGHFAGRDLGGVWVMDGVNQFSYAVANKADAYRATLPVELTEEGSIRIGIKVSDAPKKTVWVLADKFRLYYRGASPTGIREHRAEQRSSAIYNLQGIRVNHPVKHTIYIVGGKKVVY